MALKKTRPVASDNGNGAERVFEHNLVKMGVPVLGIIVLSLVTWLFQNMLSLDEQVKQNIIHIQHLHQAESKFEEQMDDIEEILTDLRVHVGRITAH